MGLFNRGKKQEVRAEASSDFVDDLVLKALLTGEDITVSKAQTIPAVAEAIHRIATMVALLPIKLYKTEVKKGKIVTTEVLGDRRTFILNKDSGDTLDQFALKRNIVRDYLLDKGAFIYLKKKDGVANELRYIPPAKITSVVNDVDPINKDGQYLILGKHYELWDLVAVLRDTEDGIMGQPLTNQINDVLSTAVSNILYELGVAKKGGSKKGFLQSEKELSDPAMKALKQAWKKLYEENSENVVVLNKGVTFEDANDNARDMQVNERKKTLREELLALFGIHSDNFDDVFRDAVLPVLEAIESALNKTMLKEDEKESLYFSFDKREILKAELKTRYEAYKTASETGWISKNEIRELENMHEIDGLDVISMGLGDVVYDIKSKTYYTPNTGDTKDFNDPKDGENPIEDAKKEEAKK